MCAFNLFPLSEIQNLKNGILCKNENDREVILVQLLLLFDGIVLIRVYTMKSTT